MRSNTSVVSSSSLPTSSACSTPLLDDESSYQKLSNDLLKEENDLLRTKLRIEDGEEEEDEDKSEHSTNLVVKRKRIRKKTYFPVYRVFRSDLRRQYGVMLNHCINSGSFAMLSDFAAEYMMPDFKYEAFSPPASISIPGVPAVPAYLGFSSRQHYIMYCAGVFNIMPDFTAKMTNIQIRTRSRSEACQLEYDVFYEANFLPIATATITEDSTTISQEQSPSATSSTCFTASNKPEDISLIKNGEISLPFESVNNSNTATTTTPVSNSATKSLPVPSIKSGKRKSATSNSNNHNNTSKHQSKPNMAVVSKPPVSVQMHGKVTIFINEIRLITGMQIQLQSTTYKCT